MKKKLLNLIIKELNDNQIREYLGVLQDLTYVYENTTELLSMTDKFKKYILNLPSNILIYIVYHDRNIIGSGTILYENKIIHNFGQVAHIEDIVISKDYQGFGYGKKLIKYLIK